MPSSSLSIKGLRCQTFEDREKAWQFTLSDMNNLAVLFAILPNNRPSKASICILIKAFILYHRFRNVVMHSVIIL